MRPEVSSQTNLNRGIHSYVKYKVNTGIVFDLETSPKKMCDFLYKRDHVWFQFTST